MTFSKEVAREARHPLSQFARVDDKLAHGVTADGADVLAVAQSLDEALTLIIAVHHLETHFLARLLVRLEHLCQVLGCLGCLGCLGGLPFGLSFILGLSRHDGCTVIWDNDAQ
jgi:hypothetical protein